MEKNDDRPWVQWPPDRCVICDKTLYGRRWGTMYCSTTCNQRAKRRRAALKKLI